jgi:CubicO group peptidase (beta-lactamase class C family)
MSSIESIVSESSKEHDVNITVVATIGSDTYCEGYRFSNTDLIPLFSISKSIVSYLCLVLQSKYMISINNPIGIYFPEIEKYKNEKTTFMWNEVTIYDLLIHRSGILSDHTSMFLFPNNNDFGIEDIVKGLCNVNCDPIRNKFSYSDLGYVLAGVAIERMTQTTLNNLIQTHLFEPLGMTDNSSDQNAIIRGDVYCRSIKQSIKYTPTPLSYATEGIALSISNLKLWLKELSMPTLILKEEIFSSAIIVPDSKQIIYASSILKSIFNSYGYGFYINDYKNIKILSHTGGSEMGLQSGLFVIPEYQTSIFILIQKEHQINLLFKVFITLLKYVERQVHNDNLS